MELLVPGLILVALMVYASTCIKRSASQAFEAETIETEEFVIDKPRGFLHVVNGDPRLAFEAYSRDFGTGASQDRRVATAEIRILRGDQGDVGSPEGGEDERSEVVDEVRYRSFQIRTGEPGAAEVTYYKVGQVNDTTYELKATVLENASDETANGIQSMIDSFRVKRSI
jgi:hypothetical protein